MLTTSRTCTGEAPTQFKSTTTANGQAAFPFAKTSRAAIAAGLCGSLALLPLVMAQGAATRRRVPRLPPAEPPHHGVVGGAGRPIRLLAIGESTVCGVGLTRGDETVAATTARALAHRTGRPVVWRAEGLSGATVRDAREQLLPRIAPEPADLLIVAFGVNDATAYRSPTEFANDLAGLVTAVRERVGDAAVIVGASLPFTAFRRCHGRFAASSTGGQPHCRRRPIACRSGCRVSLWSGFQYWSRTCSLHDGFHPNRRAHAIWGEEIATLALPLVA